VIGGAVRAARLAALPTVALAVGLAVVPSRAALLVHAWLLVLLGLLAVGAVGALGRAYPAGRSLFDRPSPADPERPRLAELARIEREVALAVASAHDAHFRLAPSVREIATALLATRRGVDLDRSPERAHELLGDEAWELVRPDRAPPHDRRGPGLDRETLERVVARLEAL
jgi:hypothetical protein